MNFIVRTSFKLNKIELSNTGGLLKILPLRKFASSSKVYNDNNVKFDFEVSKFNDIHVKSTNVIRFSEQTNYDPNVFEANLEKSLNLWKSEKRSAVWYYLPINLSNLAVILGKNGFKYHHAENDQAVLCKWLTETRPSKIPLFATHQMGVAGLVYRADKDQILCIKDRAAARDFWKLPGGAADLGEDIQDCAVREVFEETGIKSEFRSVIGFRQQHNYPTAHGRSDLYVICRLEPLTYDINACKDEIKMCEWIDVKFLLDYKENNLTRVISRIVNHGKTNGFDSIDITPKHMSSPFKGRFYNFFFRPINQQT